MQVWADLGQFATSPGFGGLAVLVGGGLAFSTGQRQLRQNRTAAVLDRRADTYVLVLEVVAALGQWAHTVASPIGEGASPIPALSDQVAAHARLLAFGSPAVRKLWDDWQDALAGVHQAARMIDVTRASAEVYPPSLAHAADYQERLESTLRSAELDARKSLARRTNQELTEGAEQREDRRRWLPWHRRSVRVAAFEH